MSNDPRFGLQVFTLGSLRILWDGEPLVGFRSDKARALLVYLAVEGVRSHRRSWLASLLWADFDERAARRSLTMTVTNLRHVLRPVAIRAGREDVIIADAQAVRLEIPPPLLWVDTAAFQELADAPLRHGHGPLFDCKECLARLEQAASLYRGDFLAGFTPRVSDAFDQWRTVQGEKLHRQALEVVEALAAYHQAARHWVSAEEYARRALMLEPWNEAAHRRLMAVLAERGQRAAALRQFELCRRTLAEELGVEPEEATLALYRRLRAQDDVEAVELANPYKGLQPFGEADYLSFYGREDFTRRLLDAVHAQPLVAVVGPSGIGKTSVVRAGLLPRLRAGGDGPAGRWLVVALRPGSHPFLSLAAALAPHRSNRPQPNGSGAADQVSELARRLQEGQLSLAEVAGGLVGAEAFGGRPRLLLFVEELEELFTLCPDPALRTAFLDWLVQSVARPGPATVLVNLRADFMAQALLHRGLADALQSASLILGPMSRSELEAAIVRPAEAQGFSFEPGLVARILDDVGEAPGQLPLLQFALAQLWENRAGRMLTHAAYEAIGRVSGALARYAEQVYGQLSPQEQALARQVFTQMALPGEGTEDTHRPVPRAELSEEAWTLVQKLANARLVVTDLRAGQETAEVVHDVLLRSWSRLREWLAADRTFRVWQQRARLAAEQWRAAGHDPDLLWRGAALSEAEEWAAARPEDLDPTVRAFVASGVQRRTREREEAEAQRQRALADAQALAEAQRRRAELEAQASRRLRWLAAGLLTAVAVALLMLVVALDQAREAQRQRDLALAAQATAVAEQQVAEAQAQRALARQLAAQTVNLADTQPDLAALLSLESLRRDRSPAAVRDLLLNLRLPPTLIRFLHGHTAAIHALAVSPDGRWLASADEVGRVWLWNVDAGQPETSFDTPGGREISSLAFGPDGRQLALGGIDGDLWLWDVERRRLVAPDHRPHADQVLALRFTADGQHLLSGGADGLLHRWQVPDLVAVGQPVDLARGVPQVEVRSVSPNGRWVAVTRNEVALTVWDLAAGRPLWGERQDHSSSVANVVFSPDGRRLATGSFDGTVIVYDLARGEPIFPSLAEHEGRVLALAFSPDSRWLASGSTDATVRLWDLESGQPIPPTLAGHANWVRTVAFSPDGARLLSGDADGRLLQWDIAGHRILPGHRAQVRGVAFDPTGRTATLASGSFDRTVAIYDANAAALRLPPLVGHTNAVLDVAFSPDGSLVASGSAGPGEIRLWDPTTGQALAALPEPGSVATTLLFSPDGRTLASGHFDGSVILWEVAQRTVRQRLQAHNDWVLALAFSPDGANLATGSRDQTVWLWDAATGAPRLGPLRGHNNWVTALAFSPDGRTLASGGGDGMIRLWDVATGRLLFSPLAGHTRPVWHLQIEARGHGQVLLSLGNEGSVLQWDLAAGQPLHPPLLLGFESESMDLSPDGQWLAVGAFDSSGLVHLWRRPQEPWEERACALANRNLTPAEWETYLGDEPYRPTCPWSFEQPEARGSN
ncbi:MAG: hypothetical protein NZ528_06470 [Caldilineales bacterium]|nr:hypothetical protein [Caldilineales bacterium]MDW8318150.1 BTAD domain-containing putative transcriptional regulator [Anaerolineae bacterium]